MQEQSEQFPRSWSMHSFRTRNFKTFLLLQGNLTLHVPWSMLPPVWLLIWRSCDLLITYGHQSTTCFKIFGLQGAETLKFPNGWIVVRTHRKRLGDRHVAWSHGKNPGQSTAPGGWSPGGSGGQGSRCAHPTLMLHEGHGHLVSLGPTAPPHSTDDSLSPISLSLSSPKFGCHSHLPSSAWNSFNFPNSWERKHVCPRSSFLHKAST